MVEDRYRPAFYLGYHLHMLWNMCSSAPNDPSSQLQNSKMSLSITSNKEILIFLFIYLLVENRWLSLTSEDLTNWTRSVITVSLLSSISFTGQAPIGRAGIVTLPASNIISFSTRLGTAAPGRPISPISV